MSSSVRKELVSLGLNNLGICYFILALSSKGEVAAVGKHAVPCAVVPVSNDINLFNQPNKGNQNQLVSVR